MRKTLEQGVERGHLPLEIKASGGIRTLMDTLLMLGNGATRIGASKGVPIVNEVEKLVRETDQKTVERALGIATRDGWNKERLSDDAVFGQPEDSVAWVQGANQGPEGSGVDAY